MALLMILSLVAATPAEAQGPGHNVVWLTNDDFTHGTYIIDTPGIYRLAEDISFNPNSTTTMGVDAYSSGFPLPTQFQHGPGPFDPFEPGGPFDARYDPRAYGIGFFAAIAIEADGVVLDLNGRTIEQSEEHALLQRFFAVIELADQPFLPAQGPADFGEGINAAENVTIKNGTIGLSAHHGIHGNDNKNVLVQNVNFVDYEVAAIALNGVDGLRVSRVNAVNRKDVPILGTFSSGQFIKHYVNELVRTGSTTTLEVNGQTLTAADIADDLRQAINNTHHDLIVDPNMVDGRAVIDAAAHPLEYGLFHNAEGVVDGNSYSFLVNARGVAVNGFPTKPDGVDRIPSRNIHFSNVHVYDQVASINEIEAIDIGTGPAIDPVGAVFQVKNVHPDTGAPLTTSSLDDATATYTGNPVANAQALVAKADANGDFATSHLDLTRQSISPDLVDWVEGNGVTTLADIDATYLCNGDSMFHVNKGVIAFKMDAAENVSMVNTTVKGLVNLGHYGSSVCGDYGDGVSHAQAALPGYGGSVVRAYTFAGSDRVRVTRSHVKNVIAPYGSAIGFDVLTDGGEISISGARVERLTAGEGGGVISPTAPPVAVGFHLGPDAGPVRITNSCAWRLNGSDGTHQVWDEAGTASVGRVCWQRGRTR